MEIARPLYLNRLVDAIGSDSVKVVTGVRRCGKSYLVFKLFKERLIANGIPANHIIEMAFDRFSSRRYRNPETFYAYATERIGADGRYFVLLDEVQLLDEFPSVLIDLMSRDNVDVYVTGSNARLLSKDVVTEFRGRGEEIRMAPLSFSEFMSAYNGDKRDGYLDYAAYGGLPGTAIRESVEAKVSYLDGLFTEVYLRDIVERNGVRDAGNLEELLDVIASGIGTLTNARRISDTFKSEKHVSISPETVERYLSHFEYAFLVERAKRYDVKGRRYIATPSKYYFSDMGLRNARMNFRQIEASHIMENIIYNELVGRGLGVDVGVVPATRTGADGKAHRTQLEVDFVCNKGSRRYYVQSALELSTPEKLDQETRALRKIGDGFKKIVITKEGFAPHYNEDGILFMNVYDFLLDGESLDR